MLKAIKETLMVDVVNSDPNVVLAANSMHWNALDELPDYAWKSLGDIWIGGNVASSVLGQRIVYELGEALNDSRGDIVLRGPSRESVTLPVGYVSNEIGAETMRLQIEMRLPESDDDDYHRVVQAELRVRYLLDALWRSKRKGVPPTIARGTDTSIDGRIRCMWTGWITAPNARECVVEYVIAATRIAPRV